MLSGNTCTSRARCVPSGCGIAAVPMNDPGLISSNLIGTIAATAVLGGQCHCQLFPGSGGLSFMLSGPISSIVPRVRNGSAASAKAGHRTASPAVAPSQEDFLGSGRLRIKSSLVLSREIGSEQTEAPSNNRVGSYIPLGAMGSDRARRSGTTSFGLLRPGLKHDAAITGRRRICMRGVIRGM